MVSEGEEGRGRLRGTARLELFSRDGACRDRRGEARPRTAEKNGGVARGRQNRKDGRGNRETAGRGRRQGVRRRGETPERQERETPRPRGTLWEADEQGTTWKATDC